MAIARAGVCVRHCTCGAGPMTAFLEAAWAVRWIIFGLLVLSCAAFGLEQIMEERK